MELKDVDTKGQFEHRIKPGIIHAPKIVNMAVEELQKIIVGNKESAEKYKALIEDSVKRIEVLTKRIDELEAKLNGKVDVQDTASTPEHQPQPADANADGASTEG